LYICSIHVKINKKSGSMPPNPPPPFPNPPFLGRVCCYVKGQENSQ
jgi:hypothetical protein